jgi:hypothetical protein
MQVATYWSMNRILSSVLFGPDCIVKASSQLHAYGGGRKASAACLGIALSISKKWSLSDGLYN